MKKLLIALSMTMLVACSSTAAETTATPASTTETTATTETAAETTTDLVSSVSMTRSTLNGDDYDAAVEELVSISNDLATKTETEAEGYVEPESGVAQVMSVSSDGFVSMSTIHAWKVESSEAGTTITVVMTDGNTISNLITKGAKGTILIHGSKYYILHVENVETVTLDYSDEDYEAGKFNSAYSGADAQLSEYTVTFNIDEIQSTFVYMFD